MTEREEQQARVAAVLADVVRAHGRAAAGDPGTLGALLRDFLGTDAVALRREVKLLTDAAAEGVPSALADDGEVGALAARLAANTATEPDAARWAVVAWAAALDRPVPVTVDPPLASTHLPDPEAPTRPRPTRLLLVALVAVAAIGVAAAAISFAGGSPDSDTVAPQPGDHWHTAYGIYACDAFLPPITVQTDPRGIHTHGDGVVHIHPFDATGSGANATLGAFMEATGLRLGDEELVVPGEGAFIDGAPCRGDLARTQVAVWDSADDAAAGAEPDHLYTNDFDRIRFTADRQALTIAFVPEGADIPPPDSIPALDNLSDVGSASAP